VAAEDPTKAITKTQAKQLLKRTAHTFRHDCGIGANGPNRDVVLCIALGHWMLPNVFYSTIAAGGIFSASSPASTGSELARQMQQVKSKLLICTKELVPIAQQAAELANFPLSRVFYLGEGPSFELFDLESNKPMPISSHELDWQRITSPSELDNSIICVLFSSGTTGLPKGVKLSHTNLVAEASLTLEPNKEYHRVHNPSRTVRSLAHLPAAHIAGVQGYFVNSVYDGGTMYWMKRFDFPLFLRHMKEYRVNTLFSVPPIFLMIAKSPLVTDQFQYVESIISGAAPMGADLQTAAEKKLGGALLTQVWGLSETTGAITAMPKGMSDDTGSVAMLVANCEARIVDDEGRDGRPGETGEVWVRGPVVTKGYWRNEVADREAFVDGWFCSGDIGVFREGKFYIIDRKKVSYSGRKGGTVGEVANGR
jgi:long-subunit acyl-CoA synthetase (AMP-forming)